MLGWTEAFLSACENLPEFSWITMYALSTYVDGAKDFFSSEGVLALCNEAEKYAVDEERCPDTYFKYNSCSKMNRHRYSERHGRAIDYKRGWDMMFHEFCDNQGIEDVFLNGYINGWSCAYKYQLFDI